MTNFFPLRVIFGIFFCSLLVLDANAQTDAVKAPTSPADTSALLEQEIVAELNLARSNPGEYAAFVAEWRNFYFGNEFRQPNRVTMTTVEGVKALDEAVAFLREVKPRLPLTLSKGMCSGAFELVKDQGTSGQTGHRASDGSYCEQRIGRFGTFDMPIGESLSYGKDTARERVITLLIDDGFANRGHRNRVFDPAFKVVGVACGPHNDGPMCVITLAGAFRDNLGSNVRGQEIPEARKPVSRSTTVRH